MAVAVVWDDPYAVPRIIGFLVDHADVLDAEGLPETAVACRRYADDLGDALDRSRVRVEAVADPLAL